MYLYTYMYIFLKAGRAMSAEISKRVCKHVPRTFKGRETSPHFEWCDHAQRFSAISDRLDSYGNTLVSVSSVHICIYIYVYLCMYIFVIPIYIYIYITCGVGSDVGAVWGSNFKPQAAFFKDALFRLSC